MPCLPSLPAYILSKIHQVEGINQNLKIETGTEQSLALISTKIAFISVLWGMTRTSFFEKSHRILTPDLRQIYNDVVER